jgi:chromate transporter
MLDIFSTFFKIGSFTFGGGFAMIPLIEREVITKKKWVTEEEVIDVFAISQSLPGAIAINSSSFIGYKIAGRKGALVATAGVVLPSFLIITLIAAFFSRFQDNSIVNAVFYGIRPTIVALILMAAFKMSKASIKDRTGVIIVALSILSVVFFDIHAILVIIGGACIGLTIYYSSPKTVSRITGNGGKKDGLS